MGFQFTDKRLTAVLCDIFERSGMEPENVTCCTNEKQTTFTITEDGEHIRLTFDTPDALKAARQLQFSMPYNFHEQHLII